MGRRIKENLVFSIAVITVIVTLLVFAGITGCSNGMLEDIKDKIAQDDPTAVTFTGVTQIGGTSGTEDSTALTLSFDVDPTTLMADNITITGATKGALSVSGTTRNLSISNITVDDGQTVSVAITSPSGYIISGSSKTANIYRKIYALRDTGPAGGLIFYDKGSYSDGWRYLEAAPSSTEWAGKVWGGYETPVTGAEGSLVGTGKQNTIDIVTQFGASEPYESKTDYAAKLCTDLESGGYDDWFLPSIDELNQMYVNLHKEGVGDFAFFQSYWSSSEANNNDAYELVTYSVDEDPGIGPSKKYYGAIVRAIHTF